MRRIYHRFQPIDALPYPSMGSQQSILLLGAVKKLQDGQNGFVQQVIFYLRRRIAFESSTLLFPKLCAGRFRFLF